MKKVYFFSTLLLMVCCSANAQQEQMYTQFMFNKLGHNPGYAGAVESPTLLAVNRSQWIGLEGAPNTQLLSYNQSLLGGHVGVGGNLVRNSIGINKDITLDLAYAYRIFFKHGYLGVGVQASMRNFSQNWADPRLVTSQPVTTDGAIPTGRQSKLLPNFGFGLYYLGFNKHYPKERWYFGISAPRMVSNNIDFADSGGELSREIQHLNAMGGMNFHLTADATLTPQVLLKYAYGAPFDAELNVSLMLYEKYYGGITYRYGGDTKRYGESVDVLLGMQATANIFFCLSYDIGLTRLKEFSAGTIEVTGRWYFNPPTGDRSTAPNL